MKKQLFALILILSYFLCNGQDVITRLSFSYEPSPIGQLLPSLPFLGIDTDGVKSSDSLWYFNGSLFITLDMLLEYEKECYNDSTEVTFGYYQGRSGEFKAIYEYEPGAWSVNLIRTEQGYVHKESTFIEFIKWMSNKYK